MENHQNTFVYFNVGAIAGVNKGCC